MTIFKFRNDLSASVSTFIPSKMIAMETTAAEIKDLAVFTFLKVSLYTAKAVGVSVQVDTWTWWQDNSAKLPHWGAAARTVVLVQPSSTTAEHIFLLIKASFNSRSKMLLFKITWSCHSCFNIILGTKNRYI